MEPAAKQPPAAPPYTVAAAADTDLPSRVCELEAENQRLRLLVGELLVQNQRLREEAKACA